MKTKLRDNYYKDAKMFLDDLKLIVSNCKTYNQKSSSYYKCADNIEKFFMARSAEILKEKNCVLKQRISMTSLIKPKSTC